MEQRSNEAETEDAGILESHLNTASADQNDVSDDIDMRDLLREVELEASLRFGSREMTLGEILSLGPGDVIELDRRIHDAVELVIGDKIVARGTAVVTAGVYGLRITQVSEVRKALESVRPLF